LRDCLWFWLHHKRYSEPPSIAVLPSSCSTESARPVLPRKHGNIVHTQKPLHLHCIHITFTFTNAFTYIFYKHVIVIHTFTYRFYIYTISKTTRYFIQHNLLTLQTATHWFFEPNPPKGDSNNVGFISGLTTNNNHSQYIYNI
jgi:hypothetical protein